MVTYNFKTIAVVPSGSDLIDIVLQRTQRKTPTVVRKSWKISRIRAFYMRKVKFTQTTFHERLSAILDGFPRLDDLHPFYSSLINVLYSRDHYKLALGQINTARTLVDNIAKDYLKMLKFGDSLYRCKQLKRAALGRMCTRMKGLGASLGYLEEVRQHLSRLPSIDPSTRTLLITGYPNVGKSSFINQISRAHVDVQPYAFTTKSLFVGHFDYKYLRWQVIDTPGILDHPLAARNTIEMQAVTALAHLHAAVLYFIDISEQCGYTIKQQVALFHNIKTLFSKKPLILVCNKIDQRKMEDLDAEDMALIQGIVKERNCELITMSNVLKTNISKVMTTACDKLLMDRVQRMANKVANHKEDILNKIHVARPVPRDNKARPVHIPSSVVAAASSSSSSGSSSAPKRRTEKDIEAEQGGPGVYSVDVRKYYDLKKDEWKWDTMPEIMNGKNVADYIDPEIEQKLVQLELEEAQLEAEYANKPDDFEDLDETTKMAVAEIRQERDIRIMDNRFKKNQSNLFLPRAAKARGRTIGDIESHLESLGLPTARVRARSKSRASRKRKSTEESEAGMDVDMADETKTPAVKPIKAKLRSKSRPASRAPTRDRSQMGLHNKRHKKQAEKVFKKAQKPFQQLSRRGVGDREYYDPMPKHLFSGKRRQGTHDWR